MFAVGSTATGGSGFEEDWVGDLPYPSEQLLIGKVVISAETANGLALVRV